MDKRSDSSIFDPLRHEHRVETIRVVGHPRRGQARFPHPFTQSVLAWVKQDGEFGCDQHPPLVAQVLNGATGWSGSGTHVGYYRFRVPWAIMGRFF
jgi:hypothetical protein